MNRSNGIQLLNELKYFIEARPKLREELRASMAWAFVESLKNEELLHQTALAMVRDGHLDPRDIAANVRNVSTSDVESAQARIFQCLEEWSRALPCDASRFISPPGKLALTSLDELADALVFFVEPEIDNMAGATEPHMAAGSPEASPRAPATAGIGGLESNGGLDRALAWVANTAADTIRAFQALALDTFLPPLHIQEETLDAGIEEELIGFQKIPVLSLIGDRERHRVPDAMKPASLTITAMRSKTWQGGFLYYTFNVLVEGAGENSAVQLTVGFICGQKSSGLRELNLRSTSATPITVEATDASAPVLILQIRHE